MDLATHDDEYFSDHSIFITDNYYELILLCETNPTNMGGNELPPAKKKLCKIKKKYVQDNKVLW